MPGSGTVAPGFPTLPSPTPPATLPRMDKLSPTLTWDAVCADPSLRDLPYKIELNRLNQIIMAPANFQHSRYQGKIAHLLQRLLKDGEAFPEAALQTADNVKVPDVVWASRGWLEAHADATIAPVAPEICVEVLSPANTVEELDAKRALYFAAGAQEVWTCADDGAMRFFNPAGPLPASALCPKFPARVKL